MLPRHPGSDGRVPDDPAESAPNPSDELYRYLFDHNPQPMWVYDLESLRFLAVNLAASQKYGYTRDEFLRMTIRDMRPAADVPRLLQNLAQSADTGLDRFGLWRHQTRGGEVLWVEILSHSVAYAGRDARLVLAHDVTERVAVEAALRESESRYRTLFDQSPVGVLHFGRDLRVLACNRALAGALGYESAEELVGFDLTQLRDRRVLPALEQGRAGERSLYEGPYHATHGDLHAWIALHVSPLYDAEGEVEGGIAVIEDITARKVAEARLAQQARALEQVNAALQQRTDELEAVLRSRDRVYTALNHELRTPISAIMLYNDLLLGGALGQLTREQHDSVKHAQRSAEHLLELVQDVLDLAQIDAGKVDLVVEPVHVEGLFVDLLATMQPIAEHRGTRIEVVQPVDGCFVVTDVRRVRQILLNLLSNALKFGGGQPVLLCCSVLPGGGLEILVTDHGRGIAPEDRERIFEDFVQVGDTREGGTGLGLSISRRLAGLLGGLLTVESEPGRGSTFRLALPADPPAASQGPPLMFTISRS